MPAIVTKCVIVLLLLLPLKLLPLPLDMSLADWWAGITLPLCWIALTRKGLPIRLPYLPAFLLILFATVLASLLSADPGTGAISALKDTYLYVWLVTLAAVFEQIDARDHRALLIAWYVGACVNAALIVAQFVHPPLLAAMSNEVVGPVANDDWYRPAGLMLNSNAAACFQVLSFVPLVLLRPPAWILMSVVALNAAAILCTGSLGAALALVLGIAVALVVLLLFSADTKTLASLVVRSTLAVCVCLGSMVLLMSGRSVFIERFQSISWGRSERSAEGRYQIWSRGVDALMSDLPLWGIGPDRFRQVGGTEMHNDWLGFAVERGLLGLLGLCLLGAMAVVRSIELFRIERARGRFRAVVFPAALAGILTVSMTHEVFHSREVWLIVAVQEAAIWRARRDSRASGS